MRLTKLSAVLAVVAAFGAACSGSSEDSNSQATSVPDVIGQSLENFREVRSFQTTFSTTTEAEGLRVITNGQAAVEAGALVYAQMSIDTGDSGQQFDELLFASTDLYMKDTAGQWFVLSPWNQGQRPDELSEFSPEDLVVDYEETAGGLIDVEELPDETIDGETFLHRAGRVSFSDVYPDAPSGTDGSVHVDLFLRTNHYLPRRVRVVTSVEFEGAKLEEDATYDFRDYDQPITPPERPAEVRPWRDLQFPEAPCTGDAFEICLARQSALEPRGDAACWGSGRRVCLLPLGQVSPDLIEHLVDHYQSQYGLDVSVMTPQEVPADMADPLRQQIDVIALLDYMFVTFPEAHLDPDAVIIGITPLDLYDQRSHFRYLFGIKNDYSNPKAVVSSMRMSPEFYGEPANDELFFSRMRKLVSKYIGLLYYGLPTSTDPLSPMYDNILGPDDLDRMNEPLPVSATP